ncbi:MAG: glycosyltransferase family 39 protein [Clostridia bacterium]
MKKLNAKKFSNLKIDLLIIAGFTLIYIIYQLVATSLMNGKYIGDEMIYFAISYDIFAGNGINDVQYPIVYPLITAVAFFFEEPYRVIQLINIFLNSLIPFVTYFFIRNMFEREKVVIISILMLVSSFAVCFPSFVMGENLMYLLFLVAFFFHFKYAGEKSLKFAFIAGLLLAVMYMTKYLALLMLPAFGLYWICQYFKKEDIKKSLIDILKNFAVYGIAYGLVVILYAFIYSNVNGLALSIDVIKEIGGFSVATGPERVGYSFIPQLKWIGMYVVYAFVLLIPCVIVIVAKIKNAKFLKEFDSKVLKLIFLSVLLVMFTCYTASRHSTLAPYNSTGNMIKLLGRYVSYASTFSIIIAVVLFDKKEMISKKKAILLALGACVSATISYLILYQDLIWTTTTAFLNVTRGRDLAGFYILGYKYLLYYCIVIIAFVFFYFIKKNIYVTACLLVAIYLPCCLASTVSVVESSINEAATTEQLWQMIDTEEDESEVELDIELD